MMIPTTGRKMTNYQIALIVIILLIIFLI